MLSDESSPSSAIRPFIVSAHPHPHQACPQVMCRHFNEDMELGGDLRRGGNGGRDKALFLAKVMMYISGGPRLICGGAIVALPEWQMAAQRTYL
jgi:hypothetical protein